MRSPEQYAKKAKTILEKYGPEYYSRIGKIGGSRGHTGGFYANRDLAREAGRRGGLTSRRIKSM